jgi:biotin operon repressor
MSSLEILRTILQEHNYSVVQLLDKHSHLSTEQIQSRAGLSRKQVYTAIKKLKAVNAIRKIQEGICINSNHKGDSQIS